MRIKAIQQSLIEAFLMPIKSIRVRYIPLLMIYFSYGIMGFTTIANNFFVKEKLGLSAVELIELSFWIMIPWSIKMIFGQLVDSVTIFGSNRRIYVYIGAILMTLGTLLLISIAGDYTFISSYNKDTIYMISMLITTIGIVMQDVVADTMSTEVIDKNQTPNEIKKELATIQVLARLSLAIAGFMVSGLGGYLAGIYSYETIFIISLFIPILSITGITFVKLNHVESSPLNKKIFFGGLGFAVFIIFMGINKIPFAQEIIFIISFSIVLYMLRELIHELDEDTIKHIKMVMIVIFSYRLSTYIEIGDGVTWWQIDVLGFDKPFFGVLAQIGATLGIIGMWIGGKYIIDKSISSILIFITIINTILALPILGMYYDLHTLIGVDARTIAILDTLALSPFDYIAGVIMLTLVAIYAPEGKKGTWFALMASFMNLAIAGGKLIGKYLNEIFVITREVKENGVVIVNADYSQLGILLWVVIIIGFIVPIVTILKFNPDK
ncbi:Folate carrier, cyanobacterial type [hydrothermal vent metagenome]|uniref:Folate carrier, cyanobacterial type n=1 Tax=hydrothermal vent metagenome TaxID=652676 RepID=A0A1W1EL70_9ZZZZ